MTPPPSHRDRGAALEAKVWYTLREYAEATGQKYDAVKRQAHRGTLQTGRVPGKKERVIFISFLKGAHPDLWASICAVEQLRPVTRKSGHG